MLQDRHVFLKKQKDKIERWAYKSKMKTTWTEVKKLKRERKRKKKEKKERK